MSETSADSDREDMDDVIGAEPEVENSVASDQSTAAMDAVGGPAVGVQTAPEAPSASAVGVQTPDFAPLRDKGQPNGDASLNRFYDVNVTVSAELGRVTMPIGQLVRLGEGSVVELNRPITGPVDLVANGVRIARGEVVVVDDCFAIHIKEIDQPGKAGG